MRLVIPVNEPAVGDEETSVTCMVVDFGDVSERTAKRKFRTVLKEWGIPVREHKRIIKEYFPNGTKQTRTTVRETTETTTQH